MACRPAPNSAAAIIYSLTLFVQSQHRLDLRVICLIVEVYWGELGVSGKRHDDLVNQTGTVCSTHVVVAEDSERQRFTVGG